MMNTEVSTVEEYGVEGLPLLKNPNTLNVFVVIAQDPEVVYGLRIFHYGTYSGGYRATFRLRAQNANLDQPMSEFEEVLAERHPGVSWTTREPTHFSFAGAAEFNVGNLTKLNEQMTAVDFAGQLWKWLVLAMGDVPLAINEEQFRALFNKEVQSRSSGIGTVKLVPGFPGFDEAAASPVIEEPME